MITLKKAAPQARIRQRWSGRHARPAERVFRNENAANPSLSISIHKQPVITTTASTQCVKRVLQSGLQFRQTVLPEGFSQTGSRSNLEHLGQAKFQVQLFAENRDQQVELFVRGTSTVPASGVRDLTQHNGSKFGNQFIRDHHIGRLSVGNRDTKDRAQTRARMRRWQSNEMQGCSGGWVQGFGI
jgi:hypothetical protein